MLRLLIYVCASYGNIPRRKLLFMFTKDMRSLQTGALQWAQMKRGHINFLIYCMFVL